MHSKNFFTAEFVNHSREKNPSPLKSRYCQIHPRSIPATFRPIPAGKPWILPDSRSPHPHAHLYFRSFLPCFLWSPSSCSSTRHPLLHLFGNASISSHQVPKLEPVHSSQQTISITWDISTLALFYNGNVKRHLNLSHCRLCSMQLLRKLVMCSVT